MALKIALFQTDIDWENPQANRMRIEQAVRGTDAGLVLLPEMFNTGFTPDAARVAEPENGETVTWMRNLAAECGRALAGSIAVRETTGGIERYHNRFLLATPDGKLMRYDKRHLFRIGGEGDFTPGRNRPVFEYGGFRILPLVCYDLRFPVWARNRQDYDLILCCASWPAARRDVWNTLLRARAIENVCYVAGVNRVGSDPSVAEYTGDSAVIDFKGHTIAAAPERQSCMVEAVLDLDGLRTFREKFPVHLDADAFAPGW